MWIGVAEGVREREWRGQYVWVNMRVELGLDLDRWELVFLWVSECISIMIDSCGWSVDREWTGVGIRGERSAWVDGHGEVVWGWIGSRFIQWDVLDCLVN